MSEETVNPQGNESQPPINVEAAFDDYLKRQAEPPADDSKEGELQANPEPVAEEGPEEQRFTVKVNGEEREIPLSELVKGYQLESDYRIKTSQVAEQARAAQAEREQAQALQAQYGQALNVYAQQLQTMQPQPPDPGLIDADPVGYLRQQQAYQNWHGQMQRVQYEQSQLAEQQRQSQEAQAYQTLAHEAELLTKAIPDWADAAKAKAGKAELTKYLKETYGFDDARLAQVADHRALVMARKAMLYDQLQAKQAQATDKVAKLPPKAPLRPGSGEISPTDGRTRAMQSLKKSGSIDDAANAFAAMLAR